MTTSEIFASVAFEYFLCESLPEAAKKVAENEELPVAEVRAIADRNEELVWETVAEMWNALERNSKKAK